MGTFNEACLQPVGWSKNVEDHLITTMGEKASLYEVLEPLRRRVGAPHTGAEYTTSVAVERSLHRVSCFQFDIARTCDEGQQSSRVLQWYLLDVSVWESMEDCLDSSEGLSYHFSPRHRTFKIHKSWFLVLGVFCVQSDVARVRNRPVINLHQCELFNVVLLCTNLFCVPCLSLTSGFHLVATHGITGKH